MQGGEFVRHASERVVSPCTQIRHGELRVTAMRARPDTRPRSPCHGNHDVDITADLDGPSHHLPENRGESLKLSLARQAI